MSTSTPPPFQTPSHCINAQCELFKDNCQAVVRLRILGPLGSKERKNPMICIHAELNGPSILGS